ncbi:MAG: hypothetical protein WCB35_07150, partial [Methanoregula sp.]|uniref:hypothetical protein n=1 Tax=Methanoregula sp. TaxID=2052170 RepID=UPI003C711902
SWDFDASLIFGRGFPNARFRGLPRRKRTLFKSLFNGKFKPVKPPVLMVLKNTPFINPVFKNKPKLSPI